MRSLSKTTGFSRPVLAGSPLESFMRRTSVVLQVVVLCAVFAGAVFVPAAFALTYENISALELKARIDDPKDKSYLIIDIRTPQEYDAGHIPEAVNLPLGTLGYKAYSLDKTKDIIAYCNTGVTSKVACQILINAGFKDVYNLTGGVQAWPYGLVPTDGRINV